jgi:hypothetical protein
MILLWRSAWPKPLRFQNLLWDIDNLSNLCQTFNNSGRRFIASWIMLSTDKIISLGSFSQNDFLNFDCVFLFKATGAVPKTTMDNQTGSKTFYITFYSWELFHENQKSIFTYLTRFTCLTHLSCLTHITCLSHLTCLTQFLVLLILLFLILLFLLILLVSHVVYLNTNIFIKFLCCIIIKFKNNFLIADLTTGSGNITNQPKQFNSGFKLSQHNLT